jgi:murein DD-endopeptidase MepM/ murein hydrolase activator NlpD
VSRRALLLVAACAAACGGDPPITRTPPDAPTREEYVKALAEFGFGSVALGRDWLAAADRALAQPIAVSLPFSETGYLAPATPSAVGYRVALRRGRRFVVEVTFDSADPAQLFLDLFELSGESDDPPRLVAEADPGARRLDHYVRRDAEYVLRLQPELLRGGQYTIVERTEASLAFPVKGHSLSVGRSGFGAPRDGGRRDHHGIDLFAPRGTPVLAAANGTVRVDTSNLGGNVIWLRDGSAGTRRSIYYAHLDSWAVQDGATVKVGDVIGFVGNTGNARTTPPHLHFGVYERGPTDPYPFLLPGDGAPPVIAGAPALLGQWARVRRAGTALLASASRRAPALATLAADTAVAVLGASAGYYRIWLPDLRTGYLAVADAVPATTPLGSHLPAAVAAVHESPARSAPRISVVAAGVPVDVLGRFDDFALVRLADATIGWLPVVHVQRP